MPITTEKLVSVSHMTGPTKPNSDYQMNARKSYKPSFEEVYKL